jgi:hypothetical protein
MMMVDAKTRTLATSICSAWVREPALPPIPLSLSTKADKNAYQHKILTYRVASVVLSLIFYSSKDARFHPLQECIDLLFFGEEPTPDSFEHLNEVKSAMSHLDSLISDGKPLSWAQGWLADFSRDQCNPVDMFIFSYYWLGQIASLLKYLGSLYPKDLI